jgi:hypothetical protein
MEDFVVRVLEADNPWLLKSDVGEWYHKFLPEKYLPRDTQLSPDHRVCLVVGPRQVGKSTLIWKYLSERKTPALFLNCEEPALRQWLTSPALVWEDLCKLVDPPVPLFFEEVRQLSEAGLFLKGLVDKRIGVPIIATGSSSFDLESKTRESLAGRAVRYLMLPLSLHETAQQPDYPEIMLARHYQNQAQKMLCYGGYPTVLLSKEPQKELAGLVESFIIRDASDRFRIRYPAAFRKVLELAASQIGNLCNYSEWSALAGISNDTVSEYVNLLQETHVIKLIRPFVGGKRAELTSSPKVYFIDNGIRNLVFGGFQSVENRPDRGPLWENFAFTEIYKHLNPLLDSIHYWRSKAGAEVDFIIKSQGRIAACEIKSGDLRGKLPRASRSFIEAYQPGLFLAVSNHSHPSISVGGTEVRFIRLFELAEAIKAWSIN